MIIYVNIFLAGDEGRWESGESVEYISFASILRKPFSLLEHLSADLREARDGCTVGVMWLLYIVNVSICVYICSVLAQVGLIINNVYSVLAMACHWFLHR